MIAKRAPAILALQCLIFAAQSSFAQAVVRFPRHDWTVKIGGDHYGLVEYGPATTVPPMQGYTVILWGKHQRSVGISIFVVASVPIIVFGLISFVAARVFARSGAVRDPQETEDDAPT